MSRLFVVGILTLMPSLATADKPRELRVEGKTLAEWRQELKNPDVERRRKAAYSLASFRLDAVDDLIGVLGDTDERVREQAASSLTSLGPRVPARLVPLLDKGSTGEKARALRVLAKFAHELDDEFAPPLGKDDRITVVRSAVPAATHLLADAETRPHALRLFRGARAMGRPALASLLALAGKVDGEARNDVLGALRAVGGDAAALPTALDVLVKAEGKAVHEANQRIWSLKLKEKPARELWPRLLEILRKSGERGYRDAVLELLLQTDEAMKAEAVAILAERLNSNDPAARARALGQIARFGPSAGKATRVIRGLLKDDSLEVVAAASSALWQIEKDADALARLHRLSLSTERIAGRGDGYWSYKAAHGIEALTWLGRDGVPGLLKALDRPEAEIRSHVVSTLTNPHRDSASSAHSEIVPRLLRLLRQEGQARLRMWVAWRMMIVALGLDSHWQLRPDRQLSGLPESRMVLKVLHYLSRYPGKTGEALPVLAPFLRDDSLEVREAAIHAIAHYGRDAKDLRGDISRLLDAWQTCYPAVYILAELGPNSAPLPADTDLWGLYFIETAKVTHTLPRPVWSKEVRWFFDDSFVPPLASALEHPDEMVRVWACESLRRHGAAARSAVPALRKALGDDDPLVRSAAIRALREVAALDGELVDFLAAAYQKGASGVRRELFVTLTAPGADARAAIPQLREGLKDKDPSTRGHCAKLLLHLTRDRIALDTLEELLDKPNPATHRFAYRELRGAGEPVVPLLRKALESHDEERREQAVLGLRAVGVWSREVIASLARALGDKDKEVAYEAAVALAKAGPAARDAIPELLAALADPDLVPAVVRALSEQGRAARAATPKLIELIESQPRPIVGLVRALGWIEPEPKEAVPVLLRLLRQERGETRLAAIEALGRIGPGAKEAVPSLRELLRESVSLTEWLAAARALWKIDRHLDAIAALVVLLRHDRGRGYEMWDVAEAVRALVETGEPAVPELRAALKGKDLGCKRRAAIALWRINKSPGAVSALVELLAVDSGSEETVDGLEEMGPAARPAIPTLKKLLDSTDVTTRQRARWLLQRLEAVGCLP